MTEQFVGLTAASVLDDNAALDGDNWTDRPEIPWPFQEGAAQIPFDVAIPALVRLGFTVREY